VDALNRWIQEDNIVEDIPPFSPFEEGITELDETEPELDETEPALDETESELDETEPALDETEPELDETELDEPEYIQGAVYKPILLAELTRRLTQIPNLKYVFIFDGLEMDSMFADIRKIRGSTVPSELAICVIRRVGEGIGYPYLTYPHSFIINSHTQSQEAADHLMTVLIGCFHATLPIDVNFITVSYGQRPINRNIHPDVKIEINNCGRVCREINSGKKFISTMLSLGAKAKPFYHKTKLSPSVRTIRMYKNDDDRKKELIGRMIQLLDHAQHSNIVAKFIRYQPKSAVVEIDNVETKISHDTLIRVAM
jgi:hypothetical protein